MKRGWLPDADSYKRPWLSWSFVCAFSIVLKAMFRVEHDMPSEFQVTGGTLVVSNHLRDADGLLIGTLLCNRRGVHVQRPIPYFALREDLFQRGALANLLHRWPAALLRPLSWVRLRWFLDGARALPMRRVREFSLRDVLRELRQAGQGGADPAVVFNQRGQRKLKRCLGALPRRVDAIDPWRLGDQRVAWWGLRDLALPVLRQLAPEFRRTVTQQLQQFAMLLDAGSTVYFAPEGSVSRSGRMGRIRAGTWRLVAMARTPPPVLFFTLSYDPLAAGRTRVVVRSQQWRQCPVLCPRDLAVAVRSQTRRHQVVTPSHLLAWFITHHPGVFGTRDVVAWLDRALAALQRESLEIDRLLVRPALGPLVDERLRWLRRKHVVQRRRGHWQNGWAAGTPPGWTSVAGQVSYMANAFADMAPRAARRLVS